jgi:hypothetical protein
MAFVYLDNAAPIEGKCYQQDDGTYLGKYMGTSDGEMRQDGPGRGTYRVVFNFENKKGIKEGTNIKVKEVPCETGGKRRKTKKRVRKHKKTQKRRR